MSSSLADRALGSHIWSHWRACSLPEKREALHACFERLGAAPEHTYFKVRGMHWGFEVPWVVEGMSPIREVAGPGLVWSADIPFRLVTT
jgi:hypothetical protein